MLKSPTYIHFRVQWQLLGPESPGQRFERQRFQDFLATLNADPLCGDFDDFSYRADRCELAKVRESRSAGVQAFTKITYANDQLTVVDEWADAGATEFSDRLVGILRSWFKHFPNTMSVMQRCWLRALLQPMHYRDSRVFIGDRVLNLGRHFAGTFVQMPHQVGLAVGCLRPWDQQQVIIDTKVNSWRDNISVWIEVAGTSALAPPINTTNPERAQVPFTMCKEFLENEVIGLIERFDTPEDNSLTGKQE